MVISIRFQRGATIAAIAMLVACSGGQNEVAPITFAPTFPPPPAVSTVPATTPDTTEAATSSTGEVTEATRVETVTTPADGLTGPMFSDALGVRVDSAPGINTRGDTRLLLEQGLHVHIAWEPDPNDSSVFTVFPEDIEILEAYANAGIDYYSAILTTVRVDPDVFGLHMVDRGAQYVESLNEARAGGFVGSLGSGVVMRPYVLGDQRTETTAVVFDCYLQNEQFILRGSEPTLSPLTPKGTVATMVKTLDGWKVDVIATEPSACF
jgi:hypothetical protein